MDNEKIGKYIASLRKEMKLTQQQLADKLKITNKAISKWENGQGLPDISILPNLAEILNTTVDEILNGENSGNNNDKSHDNEISKYIIEKNQLKYKQNCLISLAIGILGIILMIVIWTNISKWQLSFGVAIGLGVLFQIISFIIFEMSFMAIRLEINNYNNIDMKHELINLSRSSFYLKGIWVWLFIPIWCFTTIIFRYFNSDIIFNLFRFLPKAFIIPLNFIMIYFIVCILISIWFINKKK